MDMVPPNRTQAGGGRRTRALLATLLYLLSVAGLPGLHLLHHAFDHDHMGGALRLRIRLRAATPAALPAHHGHGAHDHGAGPHHHPARPAPQTPEVPSPPPDPQDAAHHGVGSQAHFALAFLPSLLPPPPPPAAPLERIGAPGAPAQRPAGPRVRDPHSPRGPPARG